MYHDHDVAGGGAGHARVTTMVVSQEHRRHGPGRKLMLVLLAAAKGVPVSLCATRMGRPLYAGLGFALRDGLGARVHQQVYRARRSDPQISKIIRFFIKN